MKSMKNLSLGRIMQTKKKDVSKTSISSRLAADAPPLDTPEANAERAVRSFCESAGPDGQQGEEVLYLPTIVDSAESSPEAANICAYQIRKSIAHGAPHQKYNAIMLTRILSDNPGETFTRNLDIKFVSAVKDLLRQSSDLNVTQMLIETLDSFERDKQHDTNLAPLLTMWKKEQSRYRNTYLQAQSVRGGAQIATDPNYFSRSHQYKGLPPPEELVSRIQEAKTSAQILSQLTRSTPSQDLLTNDLVREFANRCQSASRSIQGYMVAENPPPDNDTMLTLIETNDILQRAQSQHHRAILNARKESEIKMENLNDIRNVAPPPGPPPGHTTQLIGVSATSQSSAANREDETHSIPTDPFRDPSQSHKSAFPGNELETQDTHSYPESESYHPGFNATQSYIGRQDGAIGNATMHTAMPVANLLHGNSEDLYGASSPESSPIKTSNKGKQVVR